ncbi:MAG: helix-turn-helix transcriptional regulator [Bacteroidetes bacterium]|nr:helix-turn-helix transcriptional regulator [Bacteroidota bacterium]
MNYKPNKYLQTNVADLIRKSDENDDIDFNAHMIMYRFLSKIEELTEENKMTKKELAQRIGTSASYITQLFRGNKLLNLQTIAKFEKVFNITFIIEAKTNNQPAIFVKRHASHITG